MTLYICTYSTLCVYILSTIIFLNDFLYIFSFLNSPFYYIIAIITVVSLYITPPMNVNSNRRLLSTFHLLYFCIILLLTFRHSHEINEISRNFIFLRSGSVWCCFFLRNFLLSHHFVSYIMLTWVCGWEKQRKIGEENKKIIFVVENSIKWEEDVGGGLFLYKSVCVMRHDSAFFICCACKKCLIFLLILAFFKFYF